LGVNATNLVSGAGSDLQAQFVSISGVTTLTITNVSGAFSIGAASHGDHIPNSSNCR